MKAKIAFVSLGLVLMSMNGCEKDKKNETAESKIQLEFAMVKPDGSPLAFESPIPITEQTDVTISEMRFYFSHLYAIPQSGNPVKLSDLELFDLKKTNRTAFTFTLPAGQYKGLQFSVGLDSNQNYSDPTGFAQSHPLSAFAGMYWTWATQYRFVLVEGRANTTGNTGSNNDRAFSYHPGGNHLYVKDHIINHNFTVNEGGTTNLRLTTDVAQWFNASGGTIDPFVEFAAHDAPAEQPLAVKYITNFTESLSL